MAVGFRFAVRVCKNAKVGPWWPWVSKMLEGLPKCNPLPPGDNRFCCPNLITFCAQAGAQRAPLAAVGGRLNPVSLAGGGWDWLRPAGSAETGCGGLKLALVAASLGRLVGAAAGLGLPGLGLGWLGLAWTLCGDV